MDVAWMLGAESDTGDWELRMSMRSFWTYYLWPAQPWIIGHIPVWMDLRRVRCLPWPDPYQACKDANLLHKALRLALEPAISDPFILCSDDQILLRPSLPEDFKLWHLGEIPEEVAEEPDRWQRRLANTGRRLRDLGFPARNFDGHVPYPVRKAWIMETLRFDFGLDPGMCIFSTILNCGKQPGRPLKSGPIRGWLGSPEMLSRQVDQKLVRNQFASLNSGSMENAHIVSRLEQIFPDPAPWESDAQAWPRRSRRMNSQPSATCIFGALQ